MSKVNKPKFLNIRVASEFKKDVNDLAKSRRTSLSKIIKAHLISELKKESKLKY